MTTTSSAINDASEAREDIRVRCKLLRKNISGTVEMLAGEDGLTADRGVFVLIRAGDAWTEPAVIVDFERNGRWAIPVSLLFIPGVDFIRQETTAFILAGVHPVERRLFAVSFELKPKPDCDDGSEHGIRGLTHEG